MKRELEIKEGAVVYVDHRPLKSGDEAELFRIARPGVIEALRTSGVLVPKRVKRIHKEA